jgi:hypothetical protein
VDLQHLPAAKDVTMTAIICLAGAVVGLVIGKVSGWLVLPMVLRSLEVRSRDSTIRLPFPMDDPRRLQALVIAIYRYVMPLVFAFVGGMAAYRLFIADG